MQNPPRRRQAQFRQENTSSSVTTAVGMEEAAGRLRGKRSSLFSQTIIWITGLVCLAFLLASLAQAWSNSSLMQRVQTAQQQLQTIKKHNAQLTKLATHYKDPFVIESEARQQLGYIRPGEHPVVVTGANNSGQPTLAHTNTTSVQQGYWQEWWNAFFGN